MTAAPLKLCALCASNDAALAAFTADRWSESRPLSCRNCGTHYLRREAAVNLPGLIDSDDARARIAYGLRRMPELPHVTSAQLEQFAQTPLPTALERLDNLVIHMVKNCRPGAGLLLDPEGLRAWIGCEDADGVRWVIDQANRRGLIIDTPNNHMILTVAGWERHEELMRAGTRSRRAFMAMQFNDPELDKLFHDHLKPAVAQTGFTLRRVDGDHATAGSIDNRMRVELRTSRFVVCDLTHANAGAYWEAGFAEGLGRPVFYICSEEAFKAGPGRRPHFDVNHQLIIPWQADNPAASLKQLKAAIRATLPTEAALED